MNINYKQLDRIYKMEKASGKECYFIQHNVADLIVKYDPRTKFGEYSSQNKLQVSLEGVKISEACIKLNVDRLRVARTATI